MEPPPAGPAIPGAIAAVLVRLTALVADSADEVSVFSSLRHSIATVAARAFLTDSRPYAPVGDAASKAKTKEVPAARQPADRRPTEHRVSGTRIALIFLSSE
jgi:hypothetical protein